METYGSKPGRHGAPTIRKVFSANGEYLVPRARGRGTVARATDILSMVFGQVAAHFAAMEPRE